MNGTDCKDIGQIYTSLGKEERLKVLQEILRLSTSKELSIINHNSFLLLRIDFLKKLPFELVLRILSFCDAKSLCQASRVCKTWMKLANNDWIWHRMCNQHIDRKCQGCGWGLPLMQPFKTSVTRPWKDIYAERFVVEKNWRSGTYKTIEYKGHKGPVTCLQYDSKRDLLVSGSSDKTARVWNAKNQSLLAVLSGHTLAIRALQFDQSKIVTGSIDGKIRIWSIQDYSCIRILDAQPDGVVCLSFNQKLLASGSVEGSIKIWDLSAGIIFNLPGHSIWTNCIQLLNQNILISSSDDASIKIWDLGSKRVIKEFKGHSGPVQKFKLLDCSSLQETDLCGKIVSASLDSTIKIWDISTETCINTLYGHSDNVWDVGCDSLRIVSGSHDKKINIWDSETGLLVHSLEFSKPINCVYLLDTGLFAGDSGASMNTLALEFIPESITSVWDMPSLKTINVPPRAEFIMSIEPSPLFTIEYSSSQSLNELPSSISDYSRYLNMIYSEQSALIEAFKKYTLFNIKLRQRKNSEFKIFEIILPGLADANPMINEGDWVVMRAYQVHKTKGVITSPEEFQTRITVIIRKDNKIMAPISLPKNFKYRNVLWTVRFFPSGVSTLLTASSVAFIHSHSKLFDSILFPHLSYKKTISSGLQDEFNDTTLNDDQNAFIRTVLWRTSLAFDEYQIESELNLPTLLVGPFGTGKTMTFVKALQRIVNQFEKSKILAIAPSQSAADTIALKLLSIGMDAKKIFRFNSPLRDIFSLPWTLTEIVTMEDGLFVFPQNLLEYSIVICTTTDAQLLVYSKYTNLDISERRKETIDNVNEELKYCGLPPYKYDDLLIHWTHLAVDEAAQATEPSLAPALHLVVSDQFNVQIILSGDPQQLGPNLISEQAVKSGLSTPLMERLILHSYYRGPNAPMFNLCRNYRSHPSLLMMPSALFYSKDLIPCSMDINEGDFNYFPRIPSYSYTGIPHLKEVPIIESNWPFLFYPVRGTEKHGHLENILTAGWYNPEEATVILNLVETMIKHSKKPIKNDIGIMTVSRRQVVHLRNIFRAANLSEINIGTVEDYQGMERKYVFLSIVRVSEELVDQDVKNNSGLVNQLKRLNVAISRAQNLLIVVGSPKHLWIDNLWKQIFFFCDRNGLWMKKADEGDKIELLDINNWTVKRNLFHSSAIGSRPAFGSHDIVAQEEVMMKNMEIPQIDDFHIHLRQGPLMELVTSQLKGVRLVYVMPNTKPPIKSADQALEYRSQLQKINPDIQYIMTLYLSPDLTAEEVKKASAAGIKGVKSYPRGVTTNSDQGIEDYRTYYPVFEAMEEVGMILNLHGEIPPADGSDICVLNAEERFLTHLKQLHTDFPKLKIVLEHATTKAAVDMVKSLGDTVGCTITLHHLSLTVDDWAGQCFNYCKPVAKYPHDREALREVILQGHPRFFLGTDSAPHPRSAKECGNSAAGVYTGSLMVPYLATLLESFGALDRLVEFACINGRNFYGFPIDNAPSLKLSKTGSIVPLEYEYIDEHGKPCTLVPFMAGKKLEWTMQ